MIYYKPGYEVLMISSFVPRWVTKLQPDSSPDLVRLREIVSRTASANCGSESQQRAVLGPYLEEVYEEAKRIARTEDALGWVVAAESNLETLRLGREKAADEALARYNKNRIITGVRN